MAPSPGNLHDLGQRNTLTERAQFSSALFTQSIWQLSTSALLIFTSSWGYGELCARKILQCSDEKLQCSNTVYYTSFQFSHLIFLYINQKPDLIVLLFFPFWLTSAIASVSLLAESQPLAFV